MSGWKKSRPVFLTAIAAGTILNPLNSSMISLALRSIQDNYRLSFAAVSWLVSGFYLASAVGQPITGKLGDLVGRRKMFLIGLLIAAAASLGAPLAPTFLFLVLMRILQALGSSAVYPSGVAIIRSHVDHSKQASSLAILAIFASVMTAFGPTVGGFLIVWGGWQTIFTVNFPFILISFVLGILVIPKDVRDGAVRIKEVLHRLDIPGICLFSAGIVCLLWFLLSLEEAVHYTAAAVGLFCFVLFARREWKTARPFVDLRLMKKNHALTLVYVLFILLNIINYCLFYGLPSYFQDALHLGLRLSGALMLFMSVASVLFSLLTGRWIDHSGTAAPIIAGAAATVGGSALLLFSAVNIPFWLIGGILLIMGAGYGIGNVSLQAAMLEAAPREAAGTSTGLFQTCRYVGSILSTVVLGMIFGKTVTPQHLFLLAWVLVAVSGSALFISLNFFGKKARLSAR
ncbi:MFS transporter [Sporolactobacillus sp. KGMB 08714]|uniref:MFS transporter n=1 Tax=Sporolactobacillus sp. KGMB 08714 TaxID=3064704 RepID=UPI002FBDBE47